MEAEKRKLIEEIKLLRPKGRPPEIDFYDSGMVFALNFLYDNEEKEIIAGDIAEKLEVSTARIAKLLKKLAAKELIFTYPSENDKRKTVVRLTDKGKNHTSEKRKEHEEHLSRLIDYVGIDDMKEFVRISIKVREALEQDRSEPFDKDI